MNSAIETTLLNNIKTVLSDFPEYWNEETLLKNKVIEDLRHYDEKVITALLSNEKIKEAYALSVADMTIFKVEEFIEMLRYKNYWDNSYTKYRNEIGLTSDGKYLNYNTDVVLDFPFKDCVLEGGMSNEDEGKQEVYYHNVIAKEEIDTLFSPKTLTNIKKYDKYGEHEVSEFSDDDNLILKGNNLLALHSLKERYAGKVKLIYIDPPYNTGSDSFRYNDNFNHSTWLTFMKNRLDISKYLLSDSGCIWIQLDDNEVAYAKVLCDEIFGSDNFVNLISLKTKTAGVSGSSQGKSFIDSSEYLLVYSKNKHNFKMNDVNLSYPLMNVIDDYRKQGTSWKYTTVLVDLGEKRYLTKTKDGSNNDILVYSHKNFTRKSINALMKEEGLTEEEAYKKYINRICTSENAQTSIRTRVQEVTTPEDELISIEYVPKSGRNKGELTTLYFVGKKKRLVSWLNVLCYEEDNIIYKKERVSTLWNHINWNNVNKEGSVSFPSGQKPEELIKLIIESNTKTADLVLDFFMGSSTTQAVAMKMNRQFIGIEQMDYIDTMSIPRLQKVIGGEQGGISKDVDWQGGGSFLYAKLDSLNQHYIDKLKDITSEEELEIILEEMKSSAYLNFKVELHKVTVEDEDFSKFTLDKKKKVLIDVLDMNQLYLNYSEIDDTQYDISEEVKQFNYSFYNQGGE